MQKLTLFDLMANDIIWESDYCYYCEKEITLPSIDDIQLSLPNHDELLIRVYRGGHGHLIFIVFHKICYDHFLKTCGAFLA
jgi:hypothetical protein